MSKFASIWLAACCLSAHGASDVRSADCQSAVSQNGILRRLHSIIITPAFGNFADWQSAIQQITNLRYHHAIANLGYEEADSDSTAAAKVDQQKLQGEWTMASGSADGYPMPENMRSSARRTCKDDVTTVTVGGQLILKAKFKLDPSAKPKTIDYEANDGPTKGKTHLGIYEINGDTVKFCFGAPGAERPTEFNSKAGDQRTLSVWKQAKPGEKQPEK
jgi:uncharacterized protein (TIGR03067 family)